MAPRRAAPSSSLSSLRTIIICFFIAIVSFNGGLLIGSLTNCQCEEQNCPSTSEVKAPSHKASTDTQSFPRGMHDIVKGVSNIDRDEFAKFFDLGVPLDPSSKENQRVLLLHNKASMPSQTSEILTVEEATKNCDFLNIVLTDHGRRKQCLAVMGQYEAFHLQKFMRLPEEKGGKLSSTVPLRFVNRGAHSSGRLSTKPPTKDLNLQAWETLAPYLQGLQDALKRLEPIANATAKENTIIVMVCNHGQSELLVNFVCAAKSRGLDISQVLLFATDEETRDLAEGLGLTVFYDPSVFGHIPKEAAKRYADKTFQKVMMAKVYCVHLLSMLGYDLLFQDVDVIWYKHPLEYFKSNESEKQYDVYFQDDGNHALFYAPYSGKYQKASFVRKVEVQLLTRLSKHWFLFRPLFG